MESLAAYIPMDRRQAMGKGEDLPDRAQGAALSVDIVGSTSLTEAMVRELGLRRGAEELTRQLNEVYGTLIAEVHGRQGSVVGFSGDAITCWFDGDDGRRALACALDIQQAAGQFAQVGTGPDFSISLAVKAAVVSGPVRRFLVGDPDIQFIDVLAGATLDRLAETEKLAREGKLVVDSQTVAQLGDRARVLEWSEESEFGWRAAVVAGLACKVEREPWPDLSAAVLTEEQIRPWLLAPVYKRSLAGQDRFLAEIRPAVPLFLQFGGLDYDRDDGAGEKLDAYIRWLQSVLAHYEASLIQLTTDDKGSYLYGVFGAPLAHDDDPALAVAAAMDLLSPPPELEFITGVQIGISQGRMRVGAYGSPTRRTYGVLGDETNVAARLMTEAEAGQVLVTKRVADAVARHYRTQDLGLVEIRGKKEPVPVSVALARPAASPMQSFRTPLVGRSAELALLDQILESVGKGEGRILRLEGDAGIGKSRLAAELVERALGRGFRVAAGAGQSTSRDTVYHPWRQVFRALFELEEEPLGQKDQARWAEQQIQKVTAALGGGEPGWLARLPLLGDLLSLPIADDEITAAFDRRLRQEALFSLLVEMVETWARTRPILLLVDDAQWLDEASKGLTLALGRAIPGSPILLALVHRPPMHGEEPLLAELDPLPGFHHLKLGELSPSGMEALAAHLLSGPLSSLALSLVKVLVQGNPFFAEELVAALHEAEDIHYQDDGTWGISEALFEALLRANCLARDATSGQWVLASDAPLSAVDLDLPDSTQTVVLSRFDRLPEAHKLTLKAASVIGSTFELDLLAWSHPLQPGRPAMLEHLAALEGRDRIRRETVLPRPVYSFKHHIVQEVVYDTLLEGQQQELHAVVAAALESLQPEAVERLAYHYSRSGLRDKMLFYLDKAARKAQREYTNETALSYYDQALALEERWEWLAGKVEALHILGRRDEEKGSLRLLEVAPEVPVVDMSFLWGQYYEAIGDYAQARSHIKRALAAYRNSGDLLGEARCLAHLGLIARKQADYALAKKRYGQALDLLEGSHPNEEIQALNGLGTVYRAQGDFEQAKAYYEQALALSSMHGHRMGEAEAYHYLGGVSFLQHNFAEALPCYRRALEIRRVIGDRAGEGAGLCSLAQIASSTGDYGQAERYLDEALRVQEATGNRYEQVNVWNELGVLHLFLGDLARAQTCLQEALAISQEIGDEQGRAYILGNLALVMRDQGELAAAERLLSEGLTLAQAQEDEFLTSIFLSHLGIVNLRAGRLDQATDLAQQALTYRKKLELGAWATADLTTLAAAHLASGDIEQALGYAQQALIVLDDGGAKEAEYPHQDYFICSQVFMAAGQVEAAQAALQSAYNLVMERADTIADPALRQSFLEQVELHRTIVSEYKRLGE